MMTYKEKFSGTTGVFLYLLEKIEPLKLLEASFCISYEQFRSESITTGITLERIWGVLSPLSKALKPDDFQIQQCIEHDIQEPLCFEILDIPLFWQINFGEMKYSEFGDMERIFGREFNDTETTNFDSLYFSWQDKEKLQNWLAEKAQAPEKIIKDSIEHIPNYLIINRKQISLGAKQEAFCAFLFAQPNYFSNELNAEEAVYGQWESKKNKRIKNMAKELNKKIKPLLGRNIFEYKNESIKIVI